MHREPACAVLSDFTIDREEAGGGFLKSGDAAQQRRLAAARKAKEAGDGADRETEFDAIDDGVGAVALNDAGEFKLGHGARL